MLGTRIRKKENGAIHDIVDANENTDNQDPNLGPYNYTVDPPVPNGVYHLQIGPGSDQAFEVVEEKADPLLGIQVPGDPNQ